jgi:hypothetical protein
LHERAGVLEDDGTVARTIPEDRIAELEAGVELYRDKADRAEQWLHKVYTEIDERFIKRAQEKSRAVFGSPRASRLIA